MSTPTANYNWPKPVNAGDNNAWGLGLNTCLDDIDAQVKLVDTASAGAVPLSGSTTGAKLMTGRLDTQTATMAMNLMGSVSGTVNFDTTLYTMFILTVSNNITSITFTLPTVNVPAAYAFGMIWRVTNGGAHTITWPTSAMKFPGGVTPTLTTSGTDVLAFVFNSASAQFELIGIQLDVR